MSEDGVAVGGGIDRTLEGGMVGGNIQGKTQTLPLYIFSAAESGRFADAGQAALVTCLAGLGVYIALRFMERSE